MPSNDSASGATVPSELVDLLGGLQLDAVVLPPLNTWDSPVYDHAATFLAKLMRSHEVDCGFLHASGERQFEAKYSAEFEAVANLTLAILNSDVLSTVLRCLEALIGRSQARALRVQLILRKSANGDEFTSLVAEGDAASVIQALREIVHRPNSEQGEP